MLLPWSIPGFNSSNVLLPDINADNKSPLSQWSIRGTQQPAIVGHFTVESYHAIAVSLALIDLAKLNYLVPSGYRIKTINHPLPRQPETVVMDKVISLIIIIIIIIIIITNSSQTSSDSSGY